LKINASKSNINNNKGSNNRNYYQEKISFKFIGHSTFNPYYVTAIVRYFEYFLSFPVCIHALWFSGDALGSGAGSSVWVVAREGIETTAAAGSEAVVLYQLVLFYQHEHNFPLAKGIKPLLRAA
jgi:hypothetical protein